MEYKRICLFSVQWDYYIGFSLLPQFSYYEYELLVIIF